MGASSDSGLTSSRRPSDEQGVAAERQWATAGQVGRSTRFSLILPVFGIAQEEVLDLSQ